MTQCCWWFKIISLILICGFSTKIYSQGTISGKILDKETRETLVGATVLIEGTTTGTTSDLDGNFSLKSVPSGKHTIVCSYISYSRVVKDITVRNGEISEVTFELSGASLSLDEVTITARKNLESEAVLMMEQRNALIATRTIGAQELSRKGVSDAEGAVTKVSGISKQEGVKNVFVRGLGDRYNTTTLNGFILPSEDPEYKNISLDIFTNDMIQSVSVSKVFSAPMIGDVGGALIDIRSKELSGDSEFEIGVSSSFNSLTAGKDIYLADGMNSFGYSNASYGPDNNSIDYSYNTSLDPIKVNNPYNINASVAGGKMFLKKHRFYVAGAMGNNYRFEQGVLREITATDATNPYMDFSYNRFIRNSSHLLLGNLDLNYTNVKLSYNTLYIHNGSIYHADIYGRHSETFQVAEDYNSEGLVRRQQINDNSIIVNQFRLNGKFSERVKYNLGASINHVRGNEPDRRIFRFPSVGNGSVQLAKAENRNQRFNSELTETAIIPKFNLQYKLSTDNDKNSFIEVGYDARISYKAFAAPFNNHIWNAASDNIPAPTFGLNNVLIDPFISQDGLLNNYFKLEHFNDNYNVVRNMHGAYIDLIYQLGKSLTMNAGLRVDNAFVKIDYEVNRGMDIGSDSIIGFLISPSLNFKYVLNDKNSLRLGSSRTFTLPQDIEISPFVREGFDGLVRGNPELEISTNYNVDVVWDYYISNNEIFTLNGFYKYILKPIARVDQINSAGIKTFDNIGDHATAAGVEAEFRKRLFTLANKHHLSFGINASYIHTKHYGLDTVVFVQNINSSLEGASPYIFNADLTYTMVSGKFSMNSAFVFNYLGDKVHTIGTRGYNNLIEESVTTLDFVNSFNINNRIGLGIKAMNILNPEFTLTRKGSDSTVPSAIIRSYKRGLTFDLSVTYKF